MKHRLAVPVSGTGSLLAAMIKNGLKIDLVLSDRECLGLEIARNAGIPAVLVKRNSYGRKFRRKDYTLRFMKVLERHNITAIAMAGFMTVFHRIIFEAYAGRITNTHPSLLPSFKGDNAVQDALDFGAKVTGCTMHLATEKLDDGEILAQVAVKIKRGDTKDTLHERIKKKERSLYIKVIRAFMKRLRRESKLQKLNQRSELAQDIS